MSTRVRRREVVAMLGGVAAVWPFAACAQQRQLPVVGFLVAGTPETTAETEIAGFRKGLSEAGFIEGRNVKVEYHWNYDNPGVHAEAAADLVQRRVDLI